MLTSFIISDELESLYYISPDIQPWVFIASVIVMLLIGIFGLFGNTAIMLAYIKNDSVSLFEVTIVKT